MEIGFFGLIIGEGREGGVFRLLSLLGFGREYNSSSVSLRYFFNSSLPIFDFAFSVSSSDDENSEILLKLREEFCLFILLYVDINCLSLLL